MKKVLLLGGAGFIGFNISKYLAEKGGYKITIADNFFRAGGKVDNMLQSLVDDHNIIIISGDFTNPSSFSELEKDYETDFLTIYFQKQIFDALIIFSWPVLLVMFFYSIFNDLLLEERYETINNKIYLLSIAAYYLPVIISLVKEITLVPFVLVFKLEEILKNPKEE